MKISILTFLLLVYLSSQTFAQTLIEKEEIIFAKSTSKLDSIKVSNLIFPGCVNIETEVWTIKNLELLENYSIKVFDRWGNIVFETSNYKQDWRGTYKDTPLPQGVYLYKITISGKKKAKTGTLRIIH